MGVLLSRFKRKKQTTFQLLESLENKIKKIEDFRRDTEQRQKTIVGHLIIYSVGIYVLAAIFFYFYYFPEHTKGKILCITPLLVFPIIVVLIKRLVTWHFHRKIVRNQELISEMKDEKRQLLENVKDKETYKVAKEILEKFAPDQLRRPMQIPSSPSTSREMIASGSSPTTPVVGTPTGDLRKRPMGPPAGNLQRQAIMGPPGSPAIPNAPLSPGQFPVQRGPPMPRPVLPRDRGTLDKLVEYLVGDGPSNRYALICRQCQSHNGMALSEEFEYLAFRCCYCYHCNPARKQRPQAPRLPSSTETEIMHTSGSELESNTDTTDDSDGEELLPIESHLPEPIAMVNGTHIEEITSSSNESTVETCDPDVDTSGEVASPSESSQDVNVSQAKPTESGASVNPLATKSSSDLYLSDL